MPGRSKTDVGHPDGSRARSTETPALAPMHLGGGQRRTHSFETAASSEVACGERRSSESKRSKAGYGVEKSAPALLRLRDGSCIWSAEPAQSLTTSAWACRAAAPMRGGNTARTQTHRLKSLITSPRCLLFEASLHSIEYPRRTDTEPLTPLAEQGSLTSTRGRCTEQVPGRRKGNPRHSISSAGIWRHRDSDRATYQAQEPRAWRDSGKAGY